ncbi:MAG: hypothetical protein N3B01_09280, partial [Verrucomicrobiae bacterium]|nr:hypothetical protein [Verrucomicrobiae bacterium]
CARVCVVAVSTTHGAVYNPHGLDVPRLLTMSKQIGSRFVEAYPDAERLDCAALLELPVDVLCPCARHHTIHHGNAGRILAKLVVGGANNPITPEAEQTLAERSVLCLPDFVANCGGVLGGTMEFAMHSRAAIERVIGWQLGARIALLLRESEKQKRSPRDLAEEEALCRFAAMHRLAEQRRLSGRVFELGLEFHRRGWVPGGLMRRMSKPYFEKRAGEL